MNRITMLRETKAISEWPDWTQACYQDASLGRQSTVEAARVLGDKGTDGKIESERVDLSQYTYTKFGFCLSVRSLNAVAFNPSGESIATPRSLMSARCFSLRRFSHLKA